jgi:hypothetical protein
MSITFDDLRKAESIYNGEAIIRIDVHDEDVDKILPPFDPQIEDIIIRREERNKLSKEAKEVIKMIIESPSDVISALSTPNGLITKRSVFNGLQKIWKSKFFAEMVINELTQWANKL